MKIIVALDKNNGIGCENKLLTHVPEDLKYFKKMTTNNIVIMGRKTYESLPDKYRPLPNRVNIVISRNFSDDGCFVFSSIDEAVDFAKDVSKEENKDIFIIGGASIYKQFIDNVNELFVTHLIGDFKPDTYFPSLNNFIIDDKYNEIDNRDKNVPHYIVKYKKAD